MMTLKQSLVRSTWVAGTVVATFACGGDSPGTLTISLDNYAKVTTATSVTLTGTVTRTPAKDTRIVVRAVGGPGTPIDTAEAGKFTLPVTLNPNATNQLKVAASDASGSVSDSVTVTIRQDNQAPAIAQATPANAADAVSLNPTIQIRLSEAAILASGGGLVLSRQGVTVSGPTSISADSLTLTFTPSVQLSPNAIYRVGFSGVTDVAGNAIPSTSSACFVTTLTGSTRSNTFLDPDAPVYHTVNPPPPASLALPDLQSARFAREGALFSVIFQFIGPRVYSTTADNRAGVWMDLDVDQDSTTGYATLKDTISSVNPGLGLVSSGTRAEYFIDMEPDPDHADSAVVVRYTEPLGGQITRLLVPGACGPFMGFVMPFDALGGDDGNMNAVFLGLAGASDGSSYLDPMPGNEHFTLTLASTGPVANLAPGSTTSQWFRRARARVPLRPLN